MGFRGAGGNGALGGGGHGEFGLDPPAGGGGPPGGKRTGCDENDSGAAQWTPAQACPDRLPCRQSKGPG